VKFLCRYFDSCRNIGATPESPTDAELPTRGAFAQGEPAAEHREPLPNHRANHRLLENHSMESKGLQKGRQGAAVLGKSGRPQAIAELSDWAGNPELAHTGLQGGALHA